jgi:hypothetical protein
MNCDVKTYRAFGMILATWIMVQSAFAAEIPVKEKPSKETTHETRYGKIEVRELASAGNVPRVHVITRRFEIYTELTGSQIPALQIGKVLEALYSHLEAFTGVKIPASEPRWKVEIYANLGRYRRAAQKDRFRASGGGRYMWHTKIAYLWWQPAGTQFTRGLIIHEVAHQFHHKSGIATGQTRGIGRSKAPFFTEGFATFFEGHRWDPKTDTLYVGVSHSKRRAASAMAAVKKEPKTFESLIAGKGKGYPEVWGLIHFLVFNYPDKAMAFLQLNEDPKVAWQKAFKSVAVDERFVKKYTDWLEQLKSEPKEVRFTSWEALLKKLPVQRHILKLKTLIAQLGKHCPKSLPRLLADLESIDVDDKSAYRAFQSRYAEQLPSIARDVMASLKANDPNRQEILGQLLGVRLEIVAHRSGPRNRRLQVDLIIHGMDHQALAGKVRYQLDPATASRDSLQMTGIQVGNKLVTMQQKLPSKVVHIAAGGRFKTRLTLKLARVVKSFAVKVQVHMKWRDLPIVMTGQVDVASEPAVRGPKRVAGK